MSESEFWHLTPAQFQAYSERANARMEVEDYRSGYLIGIIRQIAGDKKPGIFDIFPWRSEFKAPREKPQGGSVFENMKSFAEKLKEKDA